MRYFSELSYKGTRYVGWQKQPQQASVQETIEKAFSTILKKEMAIVGCGRTDTGVHAKQYFLHFDFEEIIPENLTFRINQFLPEDISIKRIFEVPDSLHARFDAYSRSYEYHVHFDKNPFKKETSFYYSRAKKINFEKLQEVATLLLSYKEFFPFCKSKTDVKTMICELTRAEWIINEQEQKMVFHISANRFLRGMVRLIVGMCLNVGIGKVSIKEVKDALENQQRLKRSYSVPPQGLFLMDILYP